VPGPFSGGQRSGGRRTTTAYLAGAGDGEAGHNVAVEGEERTSPLIGTTRLVAARNGNLGFEVLVVRLGCGDSPAIVLRGFGC
jgi:hypothetical protein